MKQTERKRDTMYQTLHNPTDEKLWLDRCFSERVLCMPQNHPILHQVIWLANHLIVSNIKLNAHNVAFLLPIGIITASEPPESIMSCIFKYQNTNYCDL